MLLKSRSKSSAKFTTPRKFHFTGDKNRIGVLGEGESKYWDRRESPAFMVDFQGADSELKPETAKNNYMAAVKEMGCISEVAAKREAGKTVNQDTVNGKRNPEQARVQNRRGIQHCRR